MLAAIGNWARYAVQDARRKPSSVIEHNGIILITSVVFVGFLRSRSLLLTADTDFSQLGLSRRARYIWGY